MRPVLTAVCSCERARISTRDVACSCTIDTPTSRSSLSSIQGESKGQSKAKQSKAKQSKAGSGSVQGRRLKQTREKKEKLKPERLFSHPRKLDDGFVCGDDRPQTLRPSHECSCRQASFPGKIGQEGVNRRPHGEAKLGWMHAEMGIAP